MGIKTAILGFLALFLILNFLSAGRVLAFLLPSADLILGNMFCVLAGNLVNPVIDLGIIKLSYPTVNDLAYVGLPAFLFSFIILRIKKEWHDYKHIILVYLTMFGILFLCEKALGLWFLFISENSYGLKNCATYMDFMGQDVPYSLLNPLFLLGFLLLIIGVVSAIIKLKLMSNKHKSVSV